MQGLTAILKVIEQTNVREVIKSEDTWAGMKSVLFFVL